MATTFSTNQLNSWYTLGRNDFEQGKNFWSSYPQNAAEAGLRADDLDGTHRLFFEYLTGWREAGGDRTDFYALPW